MAQQLIDSLSAEFDPTKFKDEYRERVLELIERKAAGEEIAVQPEAEETEPAPGPDGRAGGEPGRGPLRLDDATRRRAQEARARQVTQRVRQKSSIGKSKADERRARGSSVRAPSPRAEQPRAR